MKRPPSVHEFQPVHTEGRLVGPDAAQLGLARYKRIWQMLISGAIIGLVVLVLILTFVKAEGPARLTDCLGRERALGNALGMYRSDNDNRLPPAAVWRWAISANLDMLGIGTDGMEDIGRTIRPRGFSSPMRCLGNRTTVPISYLYVDPSEYRATYPDLFEDPAIPVLVDEVNHRSVPVLRTDWSCAAVSRTDWVNQRASVYHLIRRPDWQQTFAYYVAPPTQTP
jgi:hypothetical protein